MIRIGLIGTGSISGVHLKYLQSRKDVQIAALCDINPEHLEKRRREFGGEGFAAFREMLDAVELDAVWLCTPTGVRRAPLLACAARRLPVMCEKPVARTAQQGAGIAAALKARRARVQVGYVLRSIPVVTRLREVMADDTVDVVQSFYACPIGLTRSMPAWFYDKRESGGALLDQATHDFDLLRTLVGEVVAVKGYASNPAARKKNGYTIDEAISLSFRFASGAVGSHVHSWIADRWRNEIVLSGRKRAYRLDLWRGTLVVDEGARRVTWSHDPKRMYEHENARFLEMVASGNWKANPCDYANGLKTLKLTLRCDRAVSV